MKVAVLCVFIFILSLFPAVAQEGVQTQEVEKRHSLALIFSYTHIPEARRDTEDVDFITVPTLGLDYFYRFDEKWSVGTALDIELGKYEVDFEGAPLEREVAVILGAVVGYEVLPRWAIFAGPGVEFEQNKSLFIFRFATEYSFNLKNNWSLFPNFTYDFKKEFGSYAFGIGIRKLF